VAANGTDGLHQRDYIFHVAKDTSSDALLVAGSNNTNFAVRQDLDTLANHVEVTAAGWYTLRHTFYDDGGFLAVDLRLIDDGGTVLFLETRGPGNGGNDPIAEVGGNRYAWFTTISDGLALPIDNHELCLGESCPGPAAAGQGRLPEGRLGRLRHIPEPRRLRQLRRHRRRQRPTELTGPARRADRSALRAIAS
jgi:hypothetical protein